MSKDKKLKKYAVCIKNDGYSSSLEIRKIYQTIADTKADENNLLRVIDESGEDYLYPKGFFVNIHLPRKVEEALTLNT